MLIERFIKLKPGNEDSRSRAISAFKAVSWRIVGTMDTMLISYIITQKAEIAFSIASIEVVSKMLLYYFHERAWENVRVKKNNYES